MPGSNTEMSAFPKPARITAAVFARNSRERTPNEGSLVLVRVPVPFDPKAGYPAGPGLVYVCLVCGGEISSMPSHDEACRCRCGNVAVDVDAGRASIRDHAAFRIERESAD